MKIRKITLFNIGPYKKLNTFEMEDNPKNIVLIGGKNGAGKTTFFKSIKTCLYGCKIWGYDSICRPYYDIINTLINNYEKLNNNANAYIEMEILFNDGKEDNIYTIKREWLKNKKNITEKLYIHKNDIQLGDNEKNDFNNFLLSIIPPDMFNFYFFDGEEITDYFLGSDGGKNFKEAFLKLYGLDTFSIMKENFKRNINNSKNSEIINDYYAAKSDYSNILEDKKKIESSIIGIKKEIEEIKAKKDNLINEFKNSGGITIEEWIQLNKELSLEELKREEISRKFKEVANNYLPFLILREELEKLERKIILHVENRKIENYRDIINSKEYVDFLEENNISNIKKILINYDSRKNIDNIFDFSDYEYNKIITQIHEKMLFNKKDLFDMLNDIGKSLKNTKKIRSILNNTSYDEHSKIKNETSKLEIEKLEKEKELLKLENSMQNILILEEEKNKKYLKCKENMQTLLKSESVSNISERALIYFELLEDKLIIRQSRILEQQFIKVFKKIINKNNFIDGIVIDKDINLIPYKMEKFDKEKLENYLSDAVNNNFISLFNKTYNKKISSILSGSLKMGKLPLRIESPFSNGEKQVYIMSIYLALLQTSKKDIPFFIDTPFARIDSIHKEGIIDVFFKGVNNQIFILSTDSEIYGKYKFKINDNINMTFLLNSTNHGETSIIQNEYFIGD